MQKRIYIIGYGDVGARIAPLLVERQVDVFAVARNSKQEIANEHFHYRKIDLDQCEDGPAIIGDKADIIYLAPPPTQGTIETRFKSFLANLKNNNTIPRRIVYISATGVYGDCGGEWITEETPLSPNADRSKRRVDAENQLTAWCKTHNTEWIILRVAGIYGSGKLPLARLEKGMSVLQEDIAPASNRIHIDDLANIVIAAMDSEFANEIYNVADNNPTTMTDYFTRVAAAYQLPAPLQISWEEAQKTLSPQMLSYLSESKKLDTSKLVRQLKITLRYPDLASGIDNCLKNTGG
ncbi:MAG: NAD-dependent epimerase/dehydratase family protein [Gammaproteobacteria bacterium]|nr:NAD-dependent epimerase/dehydratase family protein [Gammaproteobacteria bacterium]